MGRREEEREEVKGGGGEWDGRERREGGGC